MDYEWNHILIIYHTVQKPIFTKRFIAAIIRPIYGQILLNSTPSK